MEFDEMAYNAYERLVLSALAGSSGEAFALVSEAWESALSHPQKEKRGQICTVVARYVRALGCSRHGPPMIFTERFIHTICEDDSDLRLSDGDRQEVAEHLHFGGHSSEVQELLELWAA